MKAYDGVTFLLTPNMFLSPIIQQAVDAALDAGWTKETILMMFPINWNPSTHITRSNIVRYIDSLPA